MKSWANGSRLAAFLFALVLSGMCSKTFGAVGRTVGTYLVSPTGAATYTIPIWAPRGPNGLEPHVSLVYNSQQGSGYVGIGWALNGISSIYRCDRTYAQDGAPAAVSLSTSDAICLDGARLQLTGGSYGTAGSTYQTEIANFEQITAYGSAGNGPAYFLVQAPNGTQYEYGNTSDSRVLASGTTTAIQWYLDKVTDAAGNTMTISYSEATGSAVPSTISWTPSSYAATTYNYTMQFAYTANANASSIYGYVAGTNVENTNLLQSITIDYQGTTVKKYALTYQQSPTTGHDELTTVEECADAAQTNCLAPTTIAYQTPSPGTAATATTAVSSAPYQLDWHYDFDGDGRNDLAYCSSNTVDVAFSSSSGYGTPVNTGIACTGYVLYGDLLGSGKDGILADNGGTWYYYQWDGSSFVGQSTGLAFQAATQYALADVTGDGLPALIELQATATGTGVYVRLNTSSGSTASFSSTNSQWWATSYPKATYYLVQLESTSDGQPGNVRHLHFTGDGREDIALQDQIESCVEVWSPILKRYVEQCGWQEYAYELISTGTSFSSTQIAAISGSTAAWPLIAFLKFNSDDCTDYLYNSVIYVSGCDTTPATTVTVPSSNIIGAMDWNADGRDDILVGNGSTIGVYESTGTGITSEISTSVPYNASDVYFTFNPNGDGLAALGAWNNSSSPYAVTYFPHNGTGEPPDLMVSVTDGYGNFAKPTYVSLAQSVNSTYFEWNDAQFPYQNYIGPLYIVNQTTFNDPSNPPSGTYWQSDYYAGAWTNLQGRGFTGFGSHEVADSRNGTWETFEYDRAFPYIGMLVADVDTQTNSSSEPIFNRSYTVSDTVLDSTQYNERYFAYISAATAKEYQVGGSSNGDLIATATNNYSYDNYGNLTSESETAADDDSGSPYDGDSWTKTITNTPDVDTGTWCLRLSSNSQISYSASDGSSSVTRAQQYSPDTSHCRYTQIVTEPSSSAYQVTEGIGYDSFGNIDSDTVTGINMAARQTTANWGTTGQFPMSVTDASGATTQFNYDFSFGLVSSETDPNGLSTSWQYGDGFGRVTQETRPDGTYTVWDYNDCGVDGGCLMGAHTLARGHLVYGTGGTLITDGTVYYDELQRPIVWNDMMLASGQWNRDEVRYDSLGRVVRRAAPCVWSAVGTTCSYWTSVSYDILNRPTLVQRPISQNDSTLQSTSYAYDGDTATVTDPNGHTRTLIHDVNGWLRETEDALGYKVTLGYDAVGNRTKVTDNSGNTLWSGTYDYPVAPFLIGSTDVDTGTWGYTVDALGELTAWTDAKNQHFSMTYDALSRPHTRTEPDLFTQWTWGSSAASHNIGKLASVCTGTGSACSSSYYSENETYDSLGRPYQRSIAIPTMGTYTYTWQYNSTTGFLDTLTYPVSTSGQALKLKYAYQNGILQSITDTLDSPNVTVWQADSQNPAGQITQETLGNSLVTTRAYDAVTHWLSSVESGPGGGSSIQNQGFLYDEVGNVTQRQENNLGLSENFYYDSDNRLSYSTLNGTQNLSLNYNGMGNITSRSDVASGASWTYDPVHVHQVTEAGSNAYQYVYDANGNVTSRQGSSISWTSYNYPTLINDSATGESVSFVYGPDRSPWFEETQGPSSTELAYHVGGLMDIVVAGGSTTTRDFIYAGNEPVAVDVPGSGASGFHYFQTDEQGSITEITNSSGQLSVNESFAAFGARRDPATWSGSPTAAQLTTIEGITRHGYTFQDVLGSQMGLNQMVGRVEDAITGRFLSADPTIPDPTDPQSYNRYSYTINNPLTYTDPTGFDKVQDPENGGGGGGGVDGLTIDGKGWEWQTIYQAPNYSNNNSLDVYADVEVSGWTPAAGFGSSDSTGGMSNYLTAPQLQTITVTGTSLVGDQGSVNFAFGLGLGQQVSVPVSSGPPVRSGVGKGTQQSNPSQSDYPTVTVPGLSVTVSSTAIQDTSTIDTGLWDMSGGYESALDSEVNNVLSKAHGKGERGSTGKPEFKPKPGKLPKGVRPSSTNPGQFEVKNPQTGTWVLKPPGWSPNVGMVGGIGVLGVLGTMAAGCFESGACEAAALAF
jgi:RHS repeat-associated protein